MKNNTAKILLFDIETAPAEVYSFRIRDVNLGIDQIKKDGYVLMWAAKWLDSNEIMSDSVRQHTQHVSEYDKAGERAIAKSLRALVDEADIVVTHNGNRFDIKWLNALLIKHDLKPVSTFKSVDTYVQASKFQFISHKLDWLCRKLSLGQKIRTEFELWKECMIGNKKNWEKMERYCKHDVLLLERLYLKLRPFMQTHPNLGLFNKSGDRCCPNCGSQSIKKKGFFYTNQGKYQRYICKCGKNIRDTYRIGGVDFVGV